jgi:hypothetical protein
MNAFTYNLYRDLTCGAVAVLITLIMSAAFVQSTSVPWGMHAPSNVFVALQTEHAWFGQPEPAVLVD